jgi:hypothetical protein
MAADPDRDQTGPICSGDSRFELHDATRHALAGVKPHAGTNSFREQRAKALSLADPLRTAGNLACVDGPNSISEWDEFVTPPVPPFVEPAVAPRRNRRRWTCLPVS